MSVFRKLLMIVEEPPLPKIYQQVQYIQSHNEEYINTGVLTTSEIKMEIELFNPNMSDSQDHTLVSGGVGWGVRDFIQIQCRLNSMCHYGNSYTRVPFTGGSRIVITQDKNKFYQDGTLLSTLPTASFTTIYPIYLFCSAGSENLKEFSSFKVGTFKIYDDDVLLRDYVPCYRKADNVIGLYDLVTKTFYTNDGPGTFEKGPDVN